MIKWIRTSRLSIKNSLSLQRGPVPQPARFQVTAEAVQGYLARKKQPPPNDLHLDHVLTVLLGGGQILMSEVPL